MTISPMGIREDRTDTNRKEIRLGVFFFLLFLPLMIMNCQFGVGAPPPPPATPLPPTVSLTPVAPIPPLPRQAPTLEEGKLPAGVTVGDNTKLLGGNLHVWYKPCGNMPAEWVASIILTDMSSGSLIYLNEDGTPKASPEPVYSTDEGRNILEATLKDSSIMEQVIARPDCLNQVYKPTIQQRQGWPDAYAEDIGSPPMPKVAMGTWPAFAESPSPYGYPGWRGA